MKKTIIIAIFCIFLQLTFAQQTHMVNGENLDLITLLEGDVDLFYTIKNKSYRYFIRTKDEDFVELKNEKNEGVFNKEYTSVLKKYAPNSDFSVDKTKLTIGSLRRYINSHNKNADINYEVNNGNLRVNFRLAFFGGVTNHPLVTNFNNNNNNNNVNLQLAGELELFGDTDNPLHSGLIQVRNTFSSDGDYKSIEFSLGYRFRFLRKPGFNLYAQSRFATLNCFSVDIIDTNPENNSVDFHRKETEFNVPFIFGIGADIKLSENSFISILYDRFYAFGLENNDNFPTDITVGYKFKL